jgi:hypothetical protein
MVAPSNKRFLLESDKAAANGLAILDGTSKIPDGQFPDRLGTTGLDGAYLGQSQALLDLRKQAGVVGNGVADDAAALQTALNSAAALGVRAFARGTFKIGSTVQITSNVDLSDATFNYTGSGTAVRVGVISGYISRKEIRLPHVVNTLKTVVGWAQVAGSVGVEINNVYTANIDVPEITNFETGLRVSGTGNGTSYVNVFLGHLFNNKRNMHFTADTGGWANQNSVFGGRMSHNSEEGTTVAGTRHVLMDLTASKVNNNVFVGTSLESPNTVEYHLDCAGNDNYWFGCRWENTGTGARVIWRANSIGNLIDNGFGAHTIVETKESTTANHIRTRARSRMVGDGAALGYAVLALENSAGSASAALRVMEAGAESAGTSQTTGWAVELSAQKFKGKRAADANERAILDFQNGRFYVGAGNAATTRYFGNVGTSMGFDGSDVAFITHNAYDLGMATLRPRYIRAGTALVTGAIATASRPTAATAGKGAMIFDDTLGIPLYSDGTTWRKFSDNTAA